MTFDYIAGFFDGEGSVSTMCFAHRTGIQSTVVNIAQTGQEGIEILSQIKEFLSVHEIKAYVQTQKRRPPYRQMHHLKICSRSSVQAFLEAMTTRVSVKKVVVLDTLRFFKLYPSLRGPVTAERNRLRGRKGSVGLDRDQLLRDLTELGTRKEVAKKYGVNAYTITKYLNPEYRVKYDDYRKKWRLKKRLEYLEQRKAEACLATSGNHV